MATPANTIDLQSDSANTNGTTFLDGLENTALNFLNGVSASTQKQIANNGSMPFDPADPNFRSLVQVRNAQGGLNIGTSTAGLLLIGFVAWAIFRPKRRSE